MSCCCRPYPVFKGAKPDDLPPELVVNHVDTMGCDFIKTDGRDEPHAIMIDVSKVVGRMQFHFYTYYRRDRFRLYMDKVMFFDTGCIGNGASFLNNSDTMHEFYVPKAAKRVWIECIPNCIDGIPAPSSARASTLYNPDVRGTLWAIKTHCPDGRLAQNDSEFMKIYRTDPGKLKDIQEIW